MRMQVVVAVVAATTTLALLASGCTDRPEQPNASERDDTGRKPSREEPKPRPPRLDAVWTTSEAEQSVLSQYTRIPWADEKTVTVATKTRLLGYDAASGKRRWKVSPPKEYNSVCSTSATTNVAGVGAVVFGEGVNGGDAGYGGGTLCTKVAAIDTQTGKLLATHDIREREQYASVPRVSVGAKVMTISLDDGVVRRIRLRDGAKLSAPPLNDDDTAEADHVGGTIVVRRKSSGKDAELAAYDVDSGKRTWRRAVDPDAKLHRLLADDPVTAEVTDRTGNRVIRTYDGNGKPRRIIGKTLDGPVTATVPAAIDHDPRSLDVDDPSGEGQEGTYRDRPIVADGVLITGYRTDDSITPTAVPDPNLYAYDLRSGKPLWHRDIGSASVLGVRGGDVLLADDGAEPPYMGAVAPSEKAPDKQISMIDLHDGTPRTLGRISGEKTGFGWSGRTMFALDGSDRLTALRLPSTGSDPRQFASPEPADIFSKETGTTKPKWARNEIRPKRATGACEAVSSRTRALVWLEMKGYPPPAACTWRRSDRASGVEREVRVEMIAHTPEETTASQKPRTATKAAENAYETALRMKDSPWRGAESIDGFADEAALRTTGPINATASMAYAIARHRNVVVRTSVKANNGHLDRYANPPPHRVRRAALAALSDVLGEMGAKAPRQPMGFGGGPVTKVRPICELLRVEGRRLAPGSRQWDLAPERPADDRLGGCAWASADDLISPLRVRAYACTDAEGPGEPGRSASESARGSVRSEMVETRARLTAELKKQKEERGQEDDLDPKIAGQVVQISDVGDGGYLERTRYVDSGTLTHTLTVRQGNLVVEIDTYLESPPSAGEVDKELKKIATTVLKAHR